MRLAAEDGRRGGVGMVLEVLLDGLVAKDKAETTLPGNVDGSLEIEFLEGNDVLDGFTLFEDGVMQLVVDEPVIGDVQDRAVLEIELGKIRSLFAIAVGVLRILVCGGRGGVVVRSIGIERDGVVSQSIIPEEITRWPSPAGVESPTPPPAPTPSEAVIGTAPKNGIGIKGETRRNRLNRTRGAIADSARSARTKRTGAGGKDDARPRRRRVCRGRMRDRGRGEMRRASTGVDTTVLGEG